MSCSLASYLKRGWRRISGARARERAAVTAEFDAVLATLGPGKLAIDLGANLGDFTERMAATGADVIAFEPDPYAFERLSARLEASERLELINAAAADKAGRLALFRHPDFDSAPDRRSTASTLIGEMKHVRREDGVEVDVIDFAAFLKERGRVVDLLKVDIEGAEVVLFERVFDDESAAFLRNVFVETHERRLPELAARTQALRERSAQRPDLNINWDWR